MLLLPAPDDCGGNLPGWILSVFEDQTLTPGERGQAVHQLSKGAGLVAEKMQWARGFFVGVT